MLWPAEGASIQSGTGVLEPLVAEDVHRAAGEEFDAFAGAFKAA